MDQAHTILITSSLVSFSTIFEFFSIQELYQMQLISKKLYNKVIPHIFPQKHLAYSGRPKDFYYLTKNQDLYKVDESMKWSKVDELFNEDNNTKWQSSIQVNERWVYFIGGAYFQNKRGASEQVLRYDIKLNSLEQKAWMIDRSRQAFGLTYFRDSIFVICGASGGIWTDWVDRYSICEDKWLKMPNMLIDLVGPNAQVLSERYIYIFGGQTMQENPLMTEKFYRYDLYKNSTWEQIIFPQIDQIRNGCQCGVVTLTHEKTKESDQILIIGGTSCGEVSTLLTNLYKVTLNHNEPQKNTVKTTQCMSLKDGEIADRFYYLSGIKTSVSDVLIMVGRHGLHKVDIQSGKIVDQNKDRGYFNAFPGEFN